MSTFNSPVQLSNIYKPKIWGRQDLAPLFTMPAPDAGGGAKPSDQRIGEVWVTDDVSRLMNGPASGMTLAEASEKYGPELHGKAWPGRRFPLLAKYIFTSDWLSVQVHPDDAYAAVKALKQRIEKGAVPERIKAPNCSLVRFVTGATHGSAEAK